MKGHVAEASIVVAAPPERVWSALTDPELIRQYYLGVEVTSDWRRGSPITWSGELDGRHYEDKGEVLEAEPPTRLVHTHFSPLSGAADLPENYHTLVWTLQPVPGGTLLELRQDNNVDARAAEHSRENWLALLHDMKVLLER